MTSFYILSFVVVQFLSSIILCSVFYCECKFLKIYFYWQWQKLVKTVVKIFFWRYFVLTLLLLNIKYNPSLKERGERREGWEREIDLFKLLLHLPALTLTIRPRHTWLNITHCSFQLHITLWSWTMDSETHLKEKVSRDAQVMMAIIRNMGIEEWEPKVIQQMLEYSYKYKI